MDFMFICSRGRGCQVVPVPHMSREQLRENALQVQRDRAKPPATGTQLSLFDMPKEGQGQ